MIPMIDLTALYPLLERLDDVRPALAAHDEAAAELAKAQQGRRPRGVARKEAEAAYRAGMATWDDVIAAGEHEAKQSADIAIAKRKVDTRRHHLEQAVRGAGVPILHLVHVERQKALRRGDPELSTDVRKLHGSTVLPWRAYGPGDITPHPVVTL